jgi:hypothetical protein
MGALVSFRSIRVNFPALFSSPLAPAIAIAIALATVAQIKNKKGMIAISFHVPYKTSIPFTVPSPFPLEHYIPFFFVDESATFPVMAWPFCGVWVHNRDITRRSHTRACDHFSWKKPIGASEIFLYVV